jgi:hypothetical protein
VLEQNLVLVEILLHTCGGHGSERDPSVRNSAAATRENQSVKLAHAPLNLVLFSRDKLLHNVLPCRCSGKLQRSGTRERWCLLISPFVSKPRCASLRPSRDATGMNGFASDGGSGSSCIKT